MKSTIVAMTGASGTVYGIHLVRALVSAGRPVSLVLSDSARLVIREEQGITLKSLTSIEELSRVFGPDIKGKVEAFSFKDFTAPIASGSFPVQDMVIVPCTMGTLGSIAGGLSQNLIHRAADCILKEGRRLILVPRETPLNAIHLENMLKLTRLGVRMVPAMPGFYSGAQSVEDLVNFVVGKILDQMDIAHTLYPRWTGSFNKPEAVDMETR